MNVKNKIKKLLCLTAAMLVLMPIISACSAPFCDAELEYKQTKNGASIPQVTGFMDKDKINDKLTKIFTPYAESAQKAVSDSDGELKVAYDLVEGENSSVFNREYTLNMRMVDSKGSSLDVVKADISGLNNVSCTEKSDVTWLSEADLITSTFGLKEMGIELDLNDMDGNADEKFATELFVDVYEAFTEKELDVSDITVGNSMEDDYKKALKIGLITFYGDGEGNDNDYVYSDEVGLYGILDMTTSLINSIERDAYGRQSESITGSEFADLLRVMYNVCLVDNDENSKHSWKALGDVDFNGIVADIDKSNKKLLRRDAAEILVRITKAGPSYGLLYNDEGLTVVDDATSIWVRRAMTYCFMNYYGASVLFAPKQGLTITDAIRNAETYIFTRFSNWSLAADSESKDYNKYDVICVAGEIVKYFADRSEEERNSFEVKTVINDRDYDWFYSQRNTGEYSDVNCMPSIATMAAHWYNRKSKATVEKMRKTNEIEGGWTAYELRDGLDRYNVRYSVKDATRENIVKALDDGKIVLAQYSDRPYEQSGHCYVIYGYKKFKDSMTFIINDSDSLTDRANIFGRPSGNGDELEVNFSMWSIRRFVSDVTVVG